MKYIRFFEDLRLKDVPTVGGKNASLGQMIADLSGQGIEVPGGFAVTAQGYWHFIEANKLTQPIATALAKLTNYHQGDELHQAGATIRGLILGGTMPEDLRQEIEQAYDQL